ncbi:merozoite surface protein 2 [Reticulomyxa filosa]|uniref:Merozoite surface protein 2 n=1 Tax=Reticulomyxa filosa TaxID=46433 RepID=X6M326_RETFI|nr:merozoite surface protein 2 [Reticulomyxa filosa]|eukprot:ETO08051.1 merozoite surface protein 2 [Reticulomyxa filosa]
MATATAKAKPTTAKTTALEFTTGIVANATTTTTTAKTTRATATAAKYVKKRYRDKLNGAMVGAVANHFCNHFLFGVMSAAIYVGYIIITNINNWWQSVPNENWSCCGRIYAPNENWSRCGRIYGPNGDESNLKAFYKYWLDFMHQTFGLAMGKLNKIQTPSLTLLQQQISV